MSKPFHAARAALVVSMLLSGPALAWDSFGHMEVAAVAWDQMSTQAKERAIELIRHNPKVNEWVVQGVPPDTRDKFIFMRAATWPDLIKDDHEYHNDGGHNGDEPPATSDASQNVGYADNARHKYWHFVDTPFTMDNSPLKPALTPNAKTQIAAFRATLPANSGANDDIRSYDLVAAFGRRCSPALACDVAFFAGS
jgi:hypothetical protein